MGNPDFHFHLLHDMTVKAKKEKEIFSQDNPFLLLFIGVVMPTLLYLLWGVMELTQIPIAK